MGWLLMYSMKDLVTSTAIWQASGQVVKSGGDSSECQASMEGRPLPTTGTLLAEILPALPLTRHTGNGQTMGWVAFGLSPQDRQGWGPRAQLPFQNPELKKVTGQGASADWSDLGPTPTRQEC